MFGKNFIQFSNRFLNVGGKHARSVPFALPFGRHMHLFLLLDISKFPSILISELRLHDCNHLD